MFRKGFHVRYQYGPMVWISQSFNKSNKETDLDTEIVKSLIDCGIVT